MTNQDAIQHLRAINTQIVEDMSKFASKRIPFEQKAANAAARRLEMKAVEIAIAALEGLG